MSKKDEALKLSQDLRTLADRFSEGWHDGIKIDASDIMLLTDAAATLASEAKEQPTQQEICGGCKGSGWVTRDPDIGTDQECFVCEGKGTVEPEQPAQQEHDDSDDLTIAYMAGVRRGKELAKRPTTEDSSAVEKTAKQAHDLQVLAKSYIAEDEAATSNIGTLMTRGRKMADAILAAAPQPAQRQIVDTLRQALEVVAVGDSKDPRQDACDALIEAGFWERGSQPAQRKPLTDDKLADLWYKQSLDWMEFARAIEAAHGIKENT